MFGRNHWCLFARCIRRNDSIVFWTDLIATDRSCTAVLSPSDGIQLIGYGTRFFTVLRYHSGSEARLLANGPCATPPSPFGPTLCKCADCRKSDVPRGN